MAPPRARPQRNTGAWSSLRILNATSPITDQDLHSFLVMCIAGWKDNYDDAERRAIINALPPRYRRYEVDAAGALICPIPLQLVQDDQHVKWAIAKFREDVGEGLYEKGWQARASKAVQERQSGKFDSYLRDQAEANFGALDQDAPGSTSSTPIEILSTDGEWREDEPRGPRKPPGPRKKRPFVMLPLPPGDY